jgi:hypothetical protein
MAQQVVKEAGVAGRQLFAVLVTRKGHDSAPVAAIATLARDSIGVLMVQQRVQFHGKESHGQNNKRKTTNPFMSTPVLDWHTE